MSQPSKGHKLPEAFVTHMHTLLGEELQAYLSSFDNSKVAGLRVNTTKISPEALREIAPFELTPIPWTTDGFYVCAEARPAKDPLYHAGLYYLQEPSAMAPGAVLSPHLGDYVLDVCAAPGGKTLQLANCVGDYGLVVSNDISASRLQAVIRNIERFGLKNVVVTASDLQDFSEQQRDFYDAVLLDAPCSGEGMFRKDTAMLDYWTPESPQKYADIQMRLISHVDTVLKSGGKVMYSTCTFSTLENEAVIASALEQFSAWRVVDIKKGAPQNIDITSFRPGVALNNNHSLINTRRLYPFALQGEGHFLALLEKDDSLEAKKAPRSKGGLYYSEQLTQPPPALEAFMSEVLYDPQTPEDFRIRGNYRIHADKVLLEPAAVPDLNGVRVLRRGWYLGDLVKGRFEPAQSFAMGLTKAQIKNHITFPLEAPEVTKYLKCETLSVDVDNGWYVVCMDAYPLGWAKVVNGQLKNKYPAAWRML